MINGQPGNKICPQAPARRVLQFLMHGPLVAQPGAAAKDSPLNRRADIRVISINVNIDPAKLKSVYRRIRLRQ